MELKLLKATATLIVLAGFLISGCNNTHESIMPKGAINLNLNVQGPSGGRFEDSSIPAAIAITVKSINGRSIMDLKHLPLIAHGDGYLTSPIELDVGSYIIEEFIVKDDKNEGESYKNIDVDI